MALALILQMQMEPAGLRLRYDVGKNRFVRWQVGKGRRRTASGLRTVGDIATRSGVIGPVQASQMGRGELLIPRAQLQGVEDADVIQLLSYREADGTGPAVSSVTRLPAGVRSALPAPEPLLALPPPAGFSQPRLTNARPAAQAIKRGAASPKRKLPFGQLGHQSRHQRDRAFLRQLQNDSVRAAESYRPSRHIFKEQSMSPISASEAPIHKASVNAKAVNGQLAESVRSVSFALRERQYSQPLFLEAIAGALPALIPMLAPAVGSLIAGAAPAVGQVAGQLIRQFTPGGQPQGRQSAPGNARTRAQRPSPNQGGAQVVAQIGNLAEQVLGALGPAAQQVLTPDNLRQIMQLIQAGQSTNTAAPASQTAQQTVTSQQYVSSQQSGGLNQFSQAQVAPALLAALPALMPVLQQVLSPQTVQSIIQAPERMTGQIINGISDFARIGLQADQQLYDHLHRFLPEEPTSLHGLLANMSLGLAGDYTRQYRRVSRVQLSLNALPTQMVFGREQVLMRKGAPWQFSLSVQTPKTIENARLQVQIKSADDLKVVYDELLPAGSVSSGALEVMPRIGTDVTDVLKTGEQYILIFTLLWRNQQRQLRGAPIQQSISVMDTYLFDRVQEANEIIFLSDRSIWGDYWHQVWQYDFNEDVRRADLQSRYYLTLTQSEQSNARMDTRVRKQGDGARATIRLRSGYEYSLYELNHLLRRLNTDANPLSNDQLAALATPEFLSRFNQAAQHQGRFRGRPGDRAALWVYPSFKLQEIVFVRAATVNEQGVVTQLQETQAAFPMPAMLHFIGVSNS